MRRAAVEHRALLHRLALLGVARLPLLALGLRLRLDRRRLLGGELGLLVRDRLVRRVEAEMRALLQEVAQHKRQSQAKVQELMALM